MGPEPWKNGNERDKRHKKQTASLNSDQVANFIFFLRSILWQKDRGEGRVLECQIWRHLWLRERHEGDTEGL